MNHKAALNFGRATKEVLEAMANGDNMANRLVYNSVRKLIDAIHKQDENSKVENKGRVAPYGSAFFNKAADQVGQLIQEYEKNIPKAELEEMNPEPPENLPEIAGFKRRKARTLYKCDGPCSKDIKPGAVHFTRGHMRLCPVCYPKITNAQGGI